MESEPRRGFLETWRAQEALEVKGQYTNAIISLLRDAINLKKDREFWDALNHLGTIVAFIITQEEEDDVALSEAVGVIRDTEVLASTIEGPTSEIRQATVDLFRNDVGRIYFNPLLKFIQDRLRKMGVYSALGRTARIDPKIIDKIPDDQLDDF